MSLLSRLLAAFRTPPKAPARPATGAVTCVPTAYDPARPVHVNQVTVEELRSRIGRNRHGEHVLLMSFPVPGQRQQLFALTVAEPMPDEPVLDEVTDGDVVDARKLLIETGSVAWIDCCSACLSVKDPDAPTTKGGHGLPPGFIRARMVAVAKVAWVRVIPVPGLDRATLDAALKQH
jgi:hypothetical protein